MDTYSFLFPFLFDHVGEDLSARLSLSVQQVGWHCSLWGLIVILLFGLPLFVHFNAVKTQVRTVLTFVGRSLSIRVLLLLYSRLLHLDLLCVSLFVVQFGLQTDHLPGFVGALVSLTALLLPLPLMVVQAVAMPLAVQLNVFVLGLQKNNQRQSSIKTDTVKIE